MLLQGRLNKLYILKNRKEENQISFLLPKKYSNKIYCDSSYNWQDTVDGRGKGKICIVVNNEEPIIEEIELYFPGLKQLNNRFELEAIKKSKKIISERQLKNAAIYSDSQIAVNWAKMADVFWVPREQNLAGIVLEGG